jgi:hypothetical protein
MNLVEKLSLLCTDIAAPAQGCSQLVGQRTQLINAARGHLSEKPNSFASQCSIP